MLEGLDAGAMLEELSGERRGVPVRLRRRGALDRRRRRRPVPRRARRGAARRAAGGVPRGRARRAARGSSAATPRPTARSRPPSCARATASTARPSLAELERAGELVRGELRPGRLAEREWCDPEVLRRLRRASLAVLRKEVEPVDQRALARFLPAWQGVDRHPAAGAGVDRLREALVPLQGLALPAEVWERDVLPRRVGAYSPTWIDQLCASGELVWIGAGALGRNSGRVALYFREDLPLLGPPPSRGAPPPDVRGARAGARAAGRAARASSPTCSSTSSSRPRSSRRRCGISSGPGEVTNDAFAPLRAPRLTLARAQRERVARRRAGRFAARRRRAARRRQVQGRWSLTAPLLRGGGRPGGAPARARRAAARALRDPDPRAGARRGRSPAGSRRSTPSSRSSRRSGSRGAATSSRASAAPSSRCPARSSGCARGLGARTQPLVLAAVDPAQPYGAALPWPPRATTRTAARVAGAYVVLIGGEPVLYLERGGRGAADARRAPTIRGCEPALGGARRAGARRADQAARAREGRRRAGDRPRRWRRCWSRSASRRARGG